MKCKIIAYTETGTQLANKICELLKESNAHGRTGQSNDYGESKESTAYGGKKQDSFHEESKQGGNCDETNRWNVRGEHLTLDFKEKDWEIANCFHCYDAFIFISAAGIAVRKIAPLLQDKLTDPAVVVIDELGQFVIPILSGHVGGANALAEELAKMMKAIPVITTATDIHGMLAVDSFAAANELALFNRNQIKRVSSGLLRGNAVNIAFSDDVIITSDEKDIDDDVLGLLYRPLVVGLGCRKEKDEKELETFFLDTLKESGCDIKSVAAIASIDVKKSEPAIVNLCKKYDIPFQTYTAAELAAVPGDFEVSEFVERTVGVSDVSARAAAACGRRGRFLLKKKKENGMTISIFEKYRRVTFCYGENAVER